MVSFLRFRCLDFLRRTCLHGPRSAISISNGVDFSTVLLPFSFGSSLLCLFEANLFLESVSSTFSEVLAAPPQAYNISLCQGLHNVLQAGLPAHGFQQLLCQDRAAATIVLMRRANGTCWVFLCARTATFFCRRPLHGALRLHCCIETDIDQTGGI